MLLELADGGGGVGIVAVSHDMALIRGGNSLQDFGMNTGIIVAGEAARGFHGLINLAEENRDANGASLLMITGGPASTPVGWKADRQKLAVPAHLAMTGEDARPPYSSHYNEGQLVGHAGDSMPEDR